MKLRLKFQEQEYALENVSETANGQEVKKLASQATGVEAERIKLVALGKIIKDDKCVTTDYKLADNSLIHMMAKEPTLPTGSGSGASAASSGSTTNTATSFNTTDAGGSSRTGSAGASSSRPSNSAGTQGTTEEPEGDGTNSSSSTEWSSSATQDLGPLFGMLGGMLGGLGQGLGGQGGAGGSPGASGGSNPFAGFGRGAGGSGGSSEGGAGGASAAGPAFANLFQNLGNMAANARNNNAGSNSSGANAQGTTTSSTCYTTTSGDGSRTQRTTTSTTSSTTRTPPQSNNNRGTGAPCGGSPTSDNQQQQARQRTPQPSGNTATGTPAATASEAPPAGLGGVHVHVHVTLNELDQLPAKLEKFVKQVPYANVNVERDEQGGSSATAGGASGERGSWFSGMRPAVERVVRGANNYAATYGRGGGAVNDFFSRTGSSSAADGEAGASPSPTSHAASRGPSAAEPEDVTPLPTETKQPRNPSDDEEEDDESVLNDIGGDIKGVLQMPDFMALIAGDWSCMSKVHPILKAKMCKKCKSESPTENQLKVMTLKGCLKLRKRLESPDHPLAKQMREAGKPGVDLPAVIVVALQHVGYELSSLICRTNPLQFAKQIRGLVVRHAGVLYKYAAENWFKTKEDLDSLIKAGVIHAISSDKAQNDPTVAAMAPMMMPMVVSTIQMWAMEYERTGAYDTDVPLIVTNPLELGAKSAASATAPEVEDVLLDACLEEVTAGGSAGGMDPKVEAALEEALAGMDAAEAAHLRKEVQGGFGNGTSAAAGAPLSANYNSLYKKSE